jgi:lipopolysaccharide transport system permease protein
MAEKPTITPRTFTRATVPREQVQSAPLTTTTTADLPVVEIVPTAGWRMIDLREIWAFRGLLYILAWRDLKVRYRQTILGAGWVIAQPLIGMIIFTLVFNRVAKIQSGSGVPYALFILAGLLIWNLASAIVDRAGNSLVGSTYLISKVYFPRMLVPLSTVLVAAGDFAVSACMLVPFLVWYRMTPHISWLLAPFFVLLTAILAAGIGLWVAALNVEFRDVRVLIPFLIQTGMYASPVVYPVSALPDRYRWLALFNPMTGVLEGFRASLFGTALDGRLTLVSVVFALFVFASGAFYFRRMERQFADLL